MKTQIVVLCMLLCMAGLSSAQTTYTGATDNNFNNASNWSAGLPGADAGGNAIIDDDSVVLTASYPRTNGNFELTIGSGGTADLTVPTGMTLESGVGTAFPAGNVRVGVGAGGAGTFNIAGTFLSVGASVDLYIGDAAGGTGTVNVLDGGFFDMRKTFEVINGRLHHTTAAIASSPKDELVVDNNGILSFELDDPGSQAQPRIVGGSLAVELGSTSTLELSFLGTPSAGDSWVLINDISGFSGVVGGDGTGVFGNVVNDAGAIIDVTYDATGGQLVATVTSIGGAKIPVPAKGAEDVDPAVILGWTAGDDPQITQHLVFMSNGVATDEPNVYLVTTLPVGTTTYDPKADGTPDLTGTVDLNRDVTYYWRIDEKVEYIGDDPNYITGGTWNFDTARSTPDVGPVTPVMQFADVGDNPQFTVTATNPFTSDSTGLDFQWYKGTSPDTSNPVGANSATLTLNNVQVANDGDYYCRVTIQSNSAFDDSTSGHITVKRQMAHWTFDGTLNDVLGVWHGDLVDPNLAHPNPDDSLAVYVAGADGIADHAIRFDGDLFVAIPDANEAFNIHPYGLTVSAWVRDPASGDGTDWMRVVSKQTNYAITNHNNSNVQCRVANFGWTTSVPASVGQDTNWHLSTMTYDPITNTFAVYRDGFIVNQTSGSAINVSNDPLHIGARSDRTFNLIDGEVDDVQIYNYPLTALQIAALYNDMTGESVCVDINDPSLQYDFNSDCIVNIKDFAMFAQDWLNCVIYPDCIP
jgi:hypothetical protein